MRKREDRTGLGEECKRGGVKGKGSREMREEVRGAFGPEKRMKREKMKVKRQSGVWRGGGEVC